MNISVNTGEAFSGIFFFFSEGCTLVKKYNQMLIAIPIYLPTFLKSWPQDWFLMWEIFRPPPPPIKRSPLIFFFFK